MPILTIVVLLLALNYWGASRLPVDHRRHRLYAGTQSAGENFLCGGDHAR